MQHTYTHTYTYHTHVYICVHTSVRTMHMPRILEHEASDQPPRNAQVMTRDLGFWRRTLSTSVREIRARGMVSANYTWSGILDPYIWATASSHGRAELCDTLQRLDVGTRTADLLASWWERQGVADPDAAAGWLRDRAAATLPTPGQLTPTPTCQPVCKKT